MKDLRSFSISGTSRKPLPLEHLRNIDQCQKIHSIKITHAKLTDISDIPTSKLNNITIKNNTGIIKLPDFRSSTKKMLVTLQKCTIESIAPLINCKNIRVYFRDVTLIKPLTREEQLTLVNNKAISNWTKQNILELSKSVKTPGNIRIR